MVTAGKFSGHVALITGAAQGIGKAIALKMAREGASVALLDISPKVHQAANEIGAEGGSVMSLTVDIGDKAAVENAVKDIAGRFKKVDILVNNAGIVSPALLEDVTEDDWDRVIQVSLKGTFFCTVNVLPFMKKERYGKIVNVSSRASLGKMERTVYTTCKAGIIGLARTWALELAPHNINVNNVAPGPIATELFENANPPGSPKTEAIIKNVPLGKMGRPEDAANAVAFLASDDASFITGQTLFVCGGLSIGGVYF